MLLARLDALAVAGAVSYWLGFRGARARTRVVTTMRLLSLPCVTLAAYCALNYVYFGTPVPVSGLAKAIGGARFANWGGMRCAGMSSGLAWNMI